MECEADFVAVRLLKKPAVSQSVSQSLNHERGLCKVSGDFIIAFYPTRHAYQIGDLRKTTISLLLRLVFFFFVLCA